MQTISQIILMWIAPYVVLAATISAVSKTYLGQTVSIADSLKSVKGKLFALVSTVVVCNIFVSVGLVCCLVPGIMLAFRYAFVAQVNIIEGVRDNAARVRSRELTNGNWGRIFVVVLLYVVVYLVISTVLTFPYIGEIFKHAMAKTAYNPGIGYGIMAGITMSLMSPLSAITFVLLYYDIRIRKEGFDIEMLASNMKSSAVQSPISQ
ncbi:MAG: hypothetical protein NT018_06995 [Armatimonadetes bacterium]|nr:hypothetical protein [Armatimonadota bacterium]